MPGLTSSTFWKGGGERDHPPQGTLPLPRSGIPCKPARALPNSLELSQHKPKISQWGLEGPCLAPSPPALEVARIKHHFSQASPHGAAPTFSHRQDEVNNSTSAERASVPPWQNTHTHSTCHNQPRRRVWRAARLGWMETHFQWDGLSGTHQPDGCDMEADSRALQGRQVGWLAGLRGRKRH